MCRYSALTFCKAVKVCAFRHYFACFFYARTLLTVLVCMWQSQKSSLHWSSGISSGFNHIHNSRSVKSSSWSNAICKICIPLLAIVPLLALLALLALLSCANAKLYLNVDENIKTLTISISFGTHCFFCRGFEAEHHERALNGLPHVRFRIDHTAKRYGILTTEEVKYAMLTLFSNILRDQRLALFNPLISEDAESNRKRLKDQMQVYSFQFKQAVNCFGKQRVALCGKVGGMKDDVIIALQLAVYFSSQEHMYK